MRPLSFTETDKRKIHKKLQRQTSISTTVPKPAGVPPSDGLFVHFSHCLLGRRKGELMRRLKKNDHCAVIK